MQLSARGARTGHIEVIARLFRNLIYALFSPHTSRHLLKFTPVAISPSALIGAPASSWLILAPVADAILIGGL
jgi:hypothetical protein